MSDSISIDQSDAGHIVDPPIVDFLCHDPELKAFVAEFVPEKVFSTERKESVFLYDGTDSSRRVRELLAELSLVCGARSPITKLAHGGGGNFSMYSADGALIELHDSPSPQQTTDAYAVLQTLSQEIQLEFLRQRRSGQRRAV